ncbi:MAG: apolipoprotein N-acyltransferase [Phycisphaerae bacterium]|nr:apolipoprotein N-acyltransferase [Phycisphaerae bacterium]
MSRRATVGPSSARTTPRANDAAVAPAAPSRPWRRGLLAGLASSLLFALAFPPFGVWPLVFVALAPLVAWARTAPRARTAFLVAFVTQYPCWVILEWWIFELTPPGFVVLCAMMSLYPAIFAVLVRRVARSPRFGAWPNVVVIPLLWCAVEFARTTLVLGGYPWFALGLPLIGGWESDGTLAQSASVFGLGGLSFVAAVVNGALVDLYARRSAGAKAMAGPALAALAIVLGNAAFGVFVLARRTTSPGPRIQVMQTNLSVSNKNRWEPEAQVRDTSATIRASYDAFRAAVAGGERPALIVWPETMVPGQGLERQAIDFTVKEGLYPGSAFLDALLDLVRATDNTPLLVGSPAFLGLRTEGQRFRWERQYNSAYLVIGELPFPRYDKLELTPFGERMPLISNFDWLEQQLLAVGAPGMSFDLDSGEKPVRFAFDAGVPGRTPLRVATPICFEDTVPWTCRALAYESGERAVDLFINLSNDGWFGPGKPSTLESLVSWAEPLASAARSWERFASQGGREQHVLHARLRAIELAVPMIRSANTGLSVTIDDRGRLVDWIGRDRGHPAPGEGTIPGTFVTTVPLVDRSTVYGRIGDAWSYLLLVAGASLAIFARRPAATESAR